MMIVLQKICYPILILFLITGCGGGVAVKQVKDNCMEVQSMTERFKCYQQDIQAMITSQLNSDYRDYLSDTKDSPDPESREVFNGVTVNIILRPNGTVDRVTFLEAGRNTFFDTMVERAITNAGPFFLPADKPLNKMLLEFRYTIEVD